MIEVGPSPPFTIETSDLEGLNRFRATVKSRGRTWITVDGHREKEKESVDCVYRFLTTGDFGDMGTAEIGVVTRYWHLSPSAYLSLAIEFRPYTDPVWRFYAHPWVESAYTTYVSLERALKSVPSQLKKMINHMPSEALNAR